MSKRDISMLEIDILNIYNNDLNNILIDLSNISKEINSDADCPCYVKYIIKGLHDEISRIKDYGHNDSCKIINKIQELNS